jgi:transposase
MVAADARRAVTFSLSPGQSGDEPCGRELLRTLPAPETPVALIMDRSYEGDETGSWYSTSDSPRPPRSGRIQPWSYDRILYRRRNEIERLFRRLKGFRRIFSRFEKLDVIFTAFIHFALVVEAMRPAQS